MSRQRTWSELAFGAGFSGEENELGTALRDHVDLIDGKFTSKACCTSMYEQCYTVLQVLRPISS